MIAMRDGTRLACDLYGANAMEAPVPVVLVRLPYGKSSRFVFMDRVAARFNARGYVLAVQDVRGKFRSQGERLPFINESRDGYDTIDWLSKQPWCNGIVGMFGDSYYGFTQWAAVASQHPALRAIVPRMTTATLGDDPGSQPPGSVPALARATWRASTWLDGELHEKDLDWSLRPFISVYEDFFSRSGGRSAAFDLFAPHPVHVPAFAGPHPYDARPVPVLHCVGWWDNLAARHMADYEELAQRPGWNAVQYLSADATDHENYPVDHAPITESHDHQANEDALEALLPRYTDNALAFFDVFLKGSRAPETLPRVRWTLAHAGPRDATRWPPEEARQSEFFLDDIAAAAGGFPGARLTQTRPTNTQSVGWEHDPDALVPSMVTNEFAFLADHPDLRPLLDRADVLSFVSEEFGTPLDLAGPVRFEGTLRQSAPTTDIFVKLLDVDPAGRARVIVRGEAQLTRDDGQRAFAVNLGHTGYRLRPGHRLALLIASSDFPSHLPNSGSDENPWLTKQPLKTQQDLLSGPDSTARLVLSVVDPDAE
jgi:hypothetical protein